jgi:hypothetical protein
MAHAAERKNRVAVPASDKADAAVAEAIDAAVNDLIDNLIVPKLVEDFLRQYGPASVVAREQFGSENPRSQPVDSELDSTS